MQLALDVEPFSTVIHLPRETLQWPFPDSLIQFAESGQQPEMGLHKSQKPSGL